MLCILFVCDEGIKADAVVKPTRASTADWSGYLCAVFQHSQPDSEYWY